MASAHPSPPDEGCIQVVSPVNADALSTQLAAVALHQGQYTELVPLVNELGIDGEGARADGTIRNTNAQVSTTITDVAVSSPDSFAKVDEDGINSPIILGSAGSMTSVEFEKQAPFDIEQPRFDSAEPIVAAHREMTLVVADQPQLALSSIRENGFEMPHQQQATTHGEVIESKDKATSPVSVAVPELDESSIHPALRASRKLYGVSESDRFPSLFSQRPAGIAGALQDVENSQISAEVGKRMMIHSTSQGLVLLATQATDGQLTQSPTILSMIPDSGHGSVIYGNTLMNSSEVNNEQSILELSNTLRQVLRSTEVPRELLSDLSEFLKILLDEEQEMRGFTYDMIIHNHVDKMFSELLRSEGRTLSIDPLFEDIIQKARALEYRLQRRLGQDYMELDQKRILILKSGQGLLQNVTLNTEGQLKDGLWLIKKSEDNAKQPGNLGFEPGQWWLNIECAFRDGIVGCPDENLTFGNHGVTAIALLTGSEVRCDAPDTIKYVRTGEASEVHLRLMTQFGREVRVVRGYHLLSPHAPKAGVRYDGLYRIRSFVHKYDDGDDAEPGLYRSEITLERLPNQRPIEEFVSAIPSPSQLDDWRLYRKILSDHIRAQFGERQWYGWFVSEEQAKLARESATMHRDIIESITRFRDVARGT